MAEWQRLANTTIARYTKGVEDELTSKKLWLKVLKKKGRIEYGVDNISGDGMKWDVPYRVIPLNTNNGEGQITPRRQDYVKQATLDYIGYDMADLMTERERIKNASGPGQIVGYFKKMVERQTTDTRERFAGELYVDSSGSGNSERLSGIETMMATAGTVNITSGATRTANAADVVGYPSDTYAALSTVLANYSGSWGTQSSIATTWPAGTGDLGYDFYSPTIVCYNSTAWGGADNTWDSNCVKAVRYLLTHLQRCYDAESDMVVVLMDRDLHRRYKDKLDSKERVEISSNTGLRKFGFNGAIQQDGAELMWDYYCTGGIGYAFNFDKMTLYSAYDNLFRVKGPTWEERESAYHVISRYFGQMKFQAPRYFGKLMTIAAD